MLEKDTDMVYNDIQKRGINMFSFYKNNLDAISKLFVNQLGMTIFGHLMFAATFKTDIRIATGVLSALFYLYLIYCTGWEVGAKDRIKIDGGRMDECKHKGFLLGIAANGIYIFLSLVNLAFAALGSFVDWAESVSAIAYTFSALLNGMYASFFTSFEAPIHRYIVLAIFVLPAIIVTGVSYIAGSKNFRILVFLGLSKGPRK